jgi:hypothetical protein
MTTVEKPGEPVGTAAKQPEKTRLSFGIFRSFARWVKREKAETTFAGMTYDQMRQSAIDNPPPQRWFEQDTTGLQGPRR